MGENALALLLHLSTSPSSPIPRLTTYTRPSTVFFSYLGFFFSYSFKTAKIIYALLLSAAIAFVHFSELSVRVPDTEDKDVAKRYLNQVNGHVKGPAVNRSNHTKKSVHRRGLSAGQVWAAQAKGAAAVASVIVGSILVPNLVAIFMDKVLGRGMSWFAYEYSALALFAPAALLGEPFYSQVLQPYHVRTLLNVFFSKLQVPCCRSSFSPRS